MNKFEHKSDCSLYNLPAFPAERCDCNTEPSLLQKAARECGKRMGRILALHATHDLNLQESALEAQSAVDDLENVCQEQLSALQTENEGLKTRIKEYEDDEDLQNQHKLELIRNRDSIKSALESMTTERDELKEKLHRSTPICSVCNWTNVGCLNLGEPNGIQVWICHGCIKREHDSIESTRAENVRMGEHFGNMLDESITTKRGEWPRELFCVICNCNVSKQETHKSSCIIGRANDFFDTLSTPPTNADNSKEGK